MSTFPTTEPGPADDVGAAAAAELDDASPRPFSRRALLILWPSFLMAGVLEMLTFVVVDPDSLTLFGVTPLDWTRPAVYSITFLIYWAVISMAGALTALLDDPPQPVGAVRPWRSSPASRRQARSALLDAAEPNLPSDLDP
jgi:hypothetical protein